MGMNLSRTLCTAVISSSAMLFCPTSVAADKCSATGVIGDVKFSATHCTVSLDIEQQSVGIWFTEDPITPEESRDFQQHADLQFAKDGKGRTMLELDVCVTGGKVISSPAAVKEIGIKATHAKLTDPSMWGVVMQSESFKVEKLSGELKPGAPFAARIVASPTPIRGGKTSFSAEFDVLLPAKDANWPRSVCAPLQKR